VFSDDVRSEVQCADLSESTDRRDSAVNPVARQILARMSEAAAEPKPCVAALGPEVPGGSERANLPSAAVPTRKRGKCMTRRGGQNPSVRVGERADGSKYFFFQYWIDVPGEEKCQRRTEVVGLVGQMTKSEANRRKVDFLQKLELNSSEYRIPSSRTFASAVKYYREKFAPIMLRASTFDVADGQIRKHLEADWTDVPIEHITIDAVNEWAWKKRQQGLSWVTIKNILRTMQRVLSCYSKKAPPFSQKELAIPERDKLRMKIESRQAVSFSWTDANRIADAIRKLDGLDEGRKNRYAMVFILAAATGLRCSELFALRMNDVDFKASTIRVDESADQRTNTIGDCKNVAAYRTVFLGDPEGRETLRGLKTFIGDRINNPNELVFRSKHGSPLRETTVLHEALHPALKVLGLPQAGMHAFRHGCNRRWELAGMNPAVLRQQMGHSSAAMTARYSGEIPLAQVQAAFSALNGNKIVVLENTEHLENGAVA
jgi:integrase